MIGPGPATGGPAPGRVFGEYVVEAELGRGGMGAVYLVRHQTLGAQRALKVLHRPGDPRRLARFEREAAHLASVSHPNVVRVHEVGQTAGLPWFVMEKVDGAPLDEVMRRGRLPLDRALEVAIGAADGVAALHAAGILHRDLKPQNVVLTPEGRAVVLDLGLAVAPDRDDRLTKTGATLGTLRYMAPEQLRGAQGITARTDVFALGLILFELVTGCPAVEAEDSAVAVAAELLERPRPAPSSRDPGLPLALDAVARQALALDPARRFADAGELAAALRELRAAPGISRRAQRRRALILGGAAAVTVATITVAVAAALLPRGALDADRDAAGPAGTSPPRATLEEREAGAQRRGGERALRAIAALPPGRERLDQAARWRERYPDHPGLSELERLEGEALLTVPARTFQHPGYLSDLRFVDPAGTRAISFGGKHLVLWDLTTGVSLQRWPLRTGAFDAVVLEGGRRVVLLGGDRVLALTLPDGPLEEIARISLAGAFERPDYRSHLTDIAIDPSEELLAVGGDIPEVVLLRWPSGEEVERLGPFRSTVRDLAFSGDGRYLVSGHGDTLDREVGRAHDNAALVWLLDSGEQFARLPAFGQVKATAPLPGSTWVAMGRDGYRLVLVDIATGEQRALSAPDLPTSAVAPDAAHRGVVREVRCAASRGWLVSISSDRREHDYASELRVWHAASGRELFHALDRAHRLEGLDVTPDGRFVLAGSRSGTFELWDLRAVRE